MPTKIYDDLYPEDIPLMFTDGTKVYDKLATEFIRHKVGYFILAPSGAGKTHFIDHQTQKDWMDGDDLWMQTKAHPDGAWWNESLETIFYVDAKSDIITTEAKKYGFWIIGASCNWLQPDAIVIPDWETHKKWIGIREKTAYDGGATSEKLDQVKNHREWIISWQEKGVPKFETVAEAANFLASRAASADS